MRGVNHFDRKGNQPEGANHGFLDGHSEWVPGEKYAYSNIAFEVLGDVIAKVSGQPFEAYVKAHLLDPLEMRRTTLGPLGSAVSGYYVPPWTDVPVPEPLFDVKALAPCGGLASTATDMARWSSFVADPVADVLSPDTLEEMCEPQIMTDRQRWTGAFGLGFMLVRSGTRTYVGHTGGWPGFISGLFTHRESGTGGLALMNSTSAPDPAAFAVALADHVIENDPVDPEVWRPGTEVPADLADLVGLWFSEGSPFVFSVKQGRLEARAQALPELPAGGPPGPGDVHTRAALTVLSAPEVGGQVPSDVRLKTDIEPVAPEQALDLVGDLKRFEPPFIDITSHSAEVIFEEMADGSYRRRTKRRKSSGSKKNWVIARLAPASTLRLRLSRSAPLDPLSGWISG